MKKTGSIKTYIFGDTDYISSERYFITITTFVASLFLLALCFFHIFEGLKIAPVILAGSSSIVMLGLYYFVRFRMSLLIPKIILTVGGLIMLDFTWYSKFLSNGPVLLFVLIFAALVIWVWDRKQLGLFIALYFINLAVLFYVDYNAPEYLFEYPNPQIRSIDIFLSFFFYSILLILLLYVIKREFIRQKRKTNEVNELYYGLFDNTTIGLYQTTPSGMILSANRALIKMLNFDSLEDLLHRDLTKESYVEIDKRTEFKKTIHENGEITEFESEWFTKQGDVIVVLEAAKAVKNKNGEIIRYDGTVQDITEKKKIQRELVDALKKAEESDRLKSAFLANMSHEIRTPMNGILGFAYLLSKPNITSEEQQEYIEIIEKSGIRMLNIINDIVDISKIESGQMKLSISETNINDKLEYIYSFFKPEAQNKGLKFTLKNKLLSKEATLKTDSDKILAILINLAKNAIKYTNEGSIEFGCKNKGKYLECFVKDTGIGISKNRQEAIFERFIQADIDNKMAQQGAGLGLAISKSYVELLGGKIWVVSKEGKGASFHFTIPYISETDDKKRIIQEVSKDIEENQTKNLKILIAEDDEISEMLLKIEINPISREILIARTGIEVVEICRNNPDIDLILMDIHIPGMNGYEATQQIRQFNKDVIIIAQTAYGLSGAREKALEAGCNDYITKPINKTELLVLVQKYFKK